MIEKQKIKTMIEKYHKDKKRITLSNGKKKNYKSYMRYDIDPDQANEKYLL